MSPNIIVASVEFGAVVRSEDGGHTWSNHRKGAIHNCHTLIFHSKNGDWVYEAGGGGAAVSQDGRRTWQQPREGLDRRYGWACAADPERPEVWYVSAGPLGRKGVPQAHIDGAANSYIFRKAGGAAWEKLGAACPSPCTPPGLHPAHRPPGTRTRVRGAEQRRCLAFHPTAIVAMPILHNLGRIWRMVMVRT